MPLESTRRSSFGTPGIGRICIFSFLPMIKITKCTSNVIDYIEYSLRLLNWKFFAVVFVVVFNLTSNAILEQLALLVLHSDFSKALSLTFII